MAVRFRHTQVQTGGNKNAILIYIYSLPYLFSIISKLIQGEVINLVLVSAIFVGILLAGVWMSTGLNNKRYYRSRRFSNDTPFPMMFLASLVLGICSLIAAWLLADYKIFAAIGFGVAAMVGCWLWYGMDPVKSKHLSFNQINDADKSLEILQDSETLVLNIESSSRNLQNTELLERLNNIIAKAREVLSLLYENPKKIRKARRFLNTYLTGAESVVKRYASTHKDTKNTQLAENFREVLENIEQVFNQQQEKLISSDVFDLDVDIEVLNTLLKKQGIN